VAKQALGVLRFSPLLFVKQRCALTGITQAQMKDGFAKAPILETLGGVVMAFVLAHAVRYAGAPGPMQGATVGFFCWFGFAAVATLPSVTFERRPFALYAINNGFLVVALSVMGAILASWQACAILAADNFRVPACPPPNPPSANSVSASPAPAISAATTR
jgi:hypothetical protein